MDNNRIRLDDLPISLAGAARPRGMVALCNLSAMICC